MTDALSSTAAIFRDFYNKVYVLLPEGSFKEDALTKVLEAKESALQAFSGVTPPMTEAPTETEASPAT